jgi:hypothetical protein
MLYRHGHGGRFSGTLAFLLLAACVPTEEGTQGPCAEGEMALADGICVPQVPEENCGPGTRAALTSDVCISVGWQDCQPPFVQREDGWGCTVLTPQFSCAGPTRGAPGKEECQPLGDCSRPFPPPEATLFVDPQLDPADVSANRFRELQNAVAAAGPGDVIALLPGTHWGGFSRSTDLSLIGLCPDEVFLEPEFPTDPGMLITGAAFHLEGVQVGAFRWPLLGELGAQLSMKDVLFDGGFSYAVAAFDPGTHLEAENLVVRDIRAMPDELESTGLRVDYGATARVVAFEGSRIRGVGARLSGHGTALFLEDSLITETLPPDEPIGGGEISANINPGIKMEDSATLEMHRSALVRTSIAGIHASASNITLRQVVIQGAIGPETGSAPSAGLFASGRTSKVDLYEVTLEENDANNAVALGGILFKAEKTNFIGANVTAIELQGNGLAVEADAVADVMDSLFRDTAGPAISIEGDWIRWEEGIADPTYALVQDTLISGSTSLFSYDGAALVVGMGASADLHRVHFDNNRSSSMSSFANGDLAAFDTLVTRTRRDANDSNQGNAYMGIIDSNLLADNLMLKDNDGPGLIVADGQALVGRSTIVSNRIGVSVQGQTAIEEVDELPGELVENKVFISQDTIFWGNESRFGLSQLPLPDDLGP